MKNFTAGDRIELTISDLRKRLSKLPKELDEYFEHTIPRLDEKYHEDMLVMSQVILYTTFPLNVEDFMVAF